MTTLVRTNSSVRSELTGADVLVKHKLGEGTEGEVYAATFHGEEVALKWYAPQQAVEKRYTLLRALIDRGTPGTQFAWPLDLCRDAKTPGFGYVMPLVEPRFRKVSEHVAGRVDPDLRVLAHACVSFVEAFLRLHGAGLCYGDISWHNLLFDPLTGEVRICDNDNVGVDGGLDAFVAGTTNFMAPELILQAPGVRPSAHTDRHALAVLLFMLLVQHHPLDGKLEHDIRCKNHAALWQLYGKKPLFIFDPNDPRNRPVPGVHDNPILWWELFPPRLKELFERAFGPGLRDRDLRVVETEWRDALAALRDVAVPCADARCDAQLFAHRDDVRCWQCRTPPSRSKLRVGGHAILCAPGAQIYAHHLGAHDPSAATRAVAEVVAHPSDPSVLGLRNVTGIELTAWLPKGSSTVPSGRSVSLVPGLTLQIGDVVASYEP